MIPPHNSDQEVKPTNKIREVDYTSLEFDDGISVNIDIYILSREGTFEFSYYDGRSMCNLTSYRFWTKFCDV